jgi:hypothetical protein
MKRKIITALVALGFLAGALIAAAPAATAGPGDTVGWAANSCNATGYGTVMNMNIKVYWGVNNDRRVYVSGSDYYVTPPHLYEGMDDIVIYAKAIGGTWVAKADIQPGPAYGDWTSRVISHLNLSDSGEPKYWQAHMRWAGQICYSSILLN